MKSATAIAATNISTISKTKIKNKKNIIMLKNSKSMFSEPETTTIVAETKTITTTTTILYNRLINVISEIQNFYHHFYNDLFYRCNIKNLTNKQPHPCSKRRSKRKIMTNRHRKPKHKYSTNTKSSVNNNYNYNFSSTFNKNISTISRYKNERNYYSSSVANVCECEKSHRDYKKNLNISYQNKNYLRYFCFYFEKNLNSLRLLIVIYILALITTTAHGIDTQEKPQGKSTSLVPPLTRLHSQLVPLPLPPLPPSLLSASLNIALGTFINLTDSIHSPCYHNQNNNFKTLDCCSQTHLHHQHLNSKFKNHLNSFSKSKRYSNKQIVKNISVQYQRPKSQINQIHHNHHRHHHHSRFRDYDNQNYSNNLGNLLNKKYNINKKVIKFENIFNKNNIANNSSNNINFKKVNDEYKQENENEEEEEDVNKINSLNINKFLNHIQISDNNYKQSNKNNHKTNNSNKKNFISSNDTLVINELKNVENYKPQDDDDDGDGGENGDVEKVSNHTDDDFDYVEDEKDNFEENEFFHLLPPVTTSSIKITTNTTTTLAFKTANSTTQNHSQIQIPEGQKPPQYISPHRLMKLVMDGLGLKKPPDMKNVNISQKEYATKYQEYLQRVHIQKRSHLREKFDDFDESLLRPLQFFSVISNSSLLRHQQYSSYNEISLLRQKRYALESNEKKHSEEEDFEAKENYRNKNVERKETLEERVKNVLFLRKKYQKPRSTKKQRDERKTNIRLMFALKPDILNLSSSDIEEANTRLVLIHSPILAIRNSKNKKSSIKKPKKLCGSNTNENPKDNHQINVLNLKLYFMPKIGKRILLDGKKIDIRVDLTKPDETHTQWLQFDVTKAIKITLDDKRLQHIAFELQCDNCKRVGARILNDAYNTAADAQAIDPSTEGYQLMPVLNIIGRFEQSQRSLRPYKHESHSNDDNTHEESTTQRHYHHQTYNKNKHNRRTNCYKSNQRCCRHSMEVTFKEIKGFEFIIQPKVFDAGYCHGRCPPRYNPAHHHAMLQSLIWKQNHHKAPRPCCAPSKLVELEVLHVDEKDSEKLKISTWSDMKVVECACS